MIVLTPQGGRLERLRNDLPSVDANGILLCSCVRNEVTRLPHFLDYHRGLGVGRFLVVDNDSTDGTSSFLQSQPDVDVFRTTDSYAASHCGVHWVNALLGHFGAGHWVLVADADELLVYPDCETISLRRFVSGLEASGADALLTFMLDMYGDGPIHATRYKAGTPFLDACGYFDSDSYTLGGEGLRARIPERGGPRRRLFWPPEHAHRGRPPFLSKIPLVRWRDGLAYLASTHLIDGVTLAAITGVLLHFKLFDDFAARCEVEVARAEHWDGAAQYEAYANRLAADPNLSAMYDGSVRYRGSRQLVELGLMLA